MLEYFMNEVTRSQYKRFARSLVMRGETFILLGHFPVSLCRVWLLPFD